MNYLQGLWPDTGMTISDTAAGKYGRGKGQLRICTQSRNAPFEESLPPLLSN